MRKSFWRNDSGATAALYALALPALVGVAGIGFDYSRIASLDTELQNAADQAALAGATQLSQQEGSIANAIAAVRGGLVTNSTVFANDGGGDDVDVPEAQIFFYATKADAEAGTGALDPSDVDSDLEASFIRVQVETRTANYALTPVVGAISGDIFAEAVAGIGAALCRTPPLMICNPDEPLTNTDPLYDFNPDAFAGVGLLAKGGASGGFWAPGNFGYLDTIPGSGGGTPDLRKALGWDSPPGTCISQSANDAVDTDTGNKTDLADSLNTRFDIYQDTNACATGGNCPASINSVKDVIHPNSLTDTNACKYNDSTTQGWHQVAAAGRYLPSSNAALPATTTPLAMGHPRDICHSTSTNLCGGPMGDGFWDRDAYFRSHYNWSAADWPGYTGFTRSTDARPTTPTRYDVYKWEIEHRGETIGGKVILGPTAVSGYGKPVCSTFGTGTVPDDFTADRRRLSVAVINCKAYSVKGSTKDVPVREFMDVFLVQPSLARDRTAKDEIYVEIIGKTQSGSEGEAAGTVIRRDVPYLIR